MVDITDWASSVTKTIRSTHGLCPEPFEMTVQQFLPKEGDLLERRWVDGKVRKSFRVEPYAVVNMSKTAVALQKYIDANVKPCTEHFLKDRDDLVKDTYTMAFRHSSFATVSLPNSLEIV